MTTTDEENYLRSSLLLLKGGIFIARKVVIREEQKENQKSGRDLDNLLIEKKGKLEREFRNHKQREKLFPANRKTEVEKWDISLLTGVLQIVFRSSFTENERRAVRSIKYQRNDVYAHSATAELSFDEYSDICVELKEALRNLAAEFPQEVKTECEDIIYSCLNGPIDIKSHIEHLKNVADTDNMFLAILEKIDASGKQSMENIEKVVKQEHVCLKKDMAEDISNSQVTSCKTLRDAQLTKADFTSLVIDAVQKALQEQRSTRKVKVVDSELEVRGQDVDKHNIELAEQMIKTVTNEAIRRTQTSEEHKDIREAIQELVDEIASRTGVKSLEADIACAVIKFSYETYEQLLQLLVYLDSEDIKLRLAKLAALLSHRLETNEKLHLSTSLSVKCLQELLKELETDYHSEYKRTIHIPIQFDSVEGMANIWHYFENGGATNSLNKLSEALSAKLGTKIKLTSSLNVEEFKSASDEFGSENTSTRVTDQSRADADNSLVHDQDNQVLSPESSFLSPECDDFSGISAASIPKKKDKDPSSAKIVEETSGLDGNNETALESILPKQNHRLKEIDMEGPFYSSVHRYILETLKSRETQSEPLPTQETFIEASQIVVTESQHADRRDNQFLKSIHFDRISGPQSELEIHSDSSSDESESYNPHISYPSGRCVDLSPPPSADIRDTYFSDKWERSNPNVATVKPVFRQERDTRDIHQITAVGQYSKQPQEEKLHCFGFEQDIDLSKIEIELLIIFRFQEKTESERLQIAIKQNEGKISFKAASFEEFKAVRLDMYDCLDSVVVNVKKLNASWYELLSRKQGLSWLRSKCEKTHIKVVFETDDNRKEIVCHSFSKKESSKGIKLLDECITATIVRVRPEQQVCLRQPAWFTLKKSLDSDMTCVYLAENGTCICIDSMIDNEAEEAKQRVIQYLGKDNAGKKVATVTLESSKARCFLACIEGKLREKIEKKNGTFHVEQRSKLPLKLHLSCEGPKGVTDEMTKAVQRIWHESVDFSKLSTSADDTWLIMKALVRRDFVSKFEQKQNCFIEMSTEGEVTIPRTRVRVEDVFDSSDEETVEASASGTDVLNDEGIEDFQTASRRHQSPGKPEKRKYRGCRVHEFQSVLSEEEALRRAMEISAKDTNTEDCNAKAVAVVRPDSDSDSERGDSIEDLAECENDQLEETDDEDDTFRDLTRMNTDKDRPQKGRRYNAHIAQRDGSSNTSSSITISRTTVTLVKGVIAKQKADALVNVLSSSQSPFESVVAKAFLDVGGQGLMQMYDEASDEATNDVVVTRSSGHLNCYIVLHVKLKKSDGWEKIVRSIMSEVLGACRRHTARSIAFPPLGVGRMFRFQPEQVAKTMLSELSRQLSTETTNLKKISLVVYGDDIYDIFNKEFKTFNQASGYTRQNPHHHKSDVSDQPPSGVIRLLLAGASRLPPSGAEKQHERPKRGGHRYTGGRSSRGRSANVASHHRGARSSSSSSGNLRDSADRNRPSSDSINKKDDNRSGQKKKSNPSKNEDQVPNFSVKIIAENKKECTKATKAFCKKVKEKFLYEEIIEKKQKVSANSKRKIVNIISESGIKSIKEKDIYKLKGLKGSVSKAHADILKVLLEEKNRTEQTRKRKAKPKRETREFVERMVSDEPEAPCYWKNYKEGETLFQSAKRLIMGNKFATVELNKDSREFKSIVNMMNGTFDAQLVGLGKDAVGLDALGYSKLFVLKIERVENFSLYEQFARKRQTLFRQLHNSREVRFPKIEELQNCTGAIATSKYVHPHLDQDVHTDINEYLLFHSTKKERVSVICNDGFDLRVGSGTAMFGVGIYGAEMATKADQYADERDKRSAGQGNPKKMFLIRMVLGNGFLCSDPDPYNTGDHHVHSVTEMIVQIIAM